MKAGICLRFWRVQEGGPPGFGRMGEYANPPPDRTFKAD
jgi:hypothetical protein